MLSINFKMLPEIIGNDCDVLRILFGSTSEVYKYQFFRSFVLIEFKVSIFYREIIKREKQSLNIITLWEIDENFQI